MTKAVERDGWTRRDLLASIRNQTLVIPDLTTKLSHWPRAVNPHLPQLELEVDEYMNTLFPPGKRREGMKRIGAAYFASCWWPYASMDKLRAATFLSIWLFAWDDENDSEEFASLVSNFDAARAFRVETISYITNCLYPGVMLPQTALSKTPIISCFSDVGDIILKHYNQAQIEIFYKELVHFITMTDLEHQCRVNEELPSVANYQDRRMGSGAVGVCLAITEFCFDMEIPDGLIDDPELRSLWQLTNIIICGVNDILSMKKEITHGHVESLVPLIYNEQGTLQEALDKAVAMVFEAVQHFDTNAEKLLNMYYESSVQYQALSKFIAGCQFACTANLDWSLSSGRYKLGQSLADGTYVIKL